MWGHLEFTAKSHGSGSLSVLTLIRLVKLSFGKGVTEKRMGSRGATKLTPRWVEAAVYRLTVILLGAKMPVHGCNPTGQLLHNFNSWSSWTGRSKSKLHP
jgi:hypothetical protein